jgi:hypothetical protein
MVMSTAAPRGVSPQCFWFSVQVPSHKFEFSFLNGNLMVPVSHLLICRGDGNAGVRRRHFLITWQGGVVGYQDGDQSSCMRALRLRIAQLSQKNSNFDQVESFLDLHIRFRVVRRQVWSCHQVSIERAAWVSIRT